MKLFVSWNADEVDLMTNRASLADNSEEVSRIGQAVDRGNRIWTSWAESHGGKAVSVGGEGGRLEIEADYLSELPGIREQYEGAVNSTCSVGVGTKLSEADRSLMAATAQGGDRIQLYTEEVEEILAEDEGEGKLNKTQPSAPSTPAAPTEGSEHSENEVLQSQIANAPAPPGAPQTSAVDYEQLFHQLAAAQEETPAGKPPGVVDGVREQVVQILQQVRGHAQELEQMKQTNPEVYASVVGVVQAMIAMARGSMGDEGQPEQGQPVEKAEKLGRCKWKLGERRCQRKVTTDYCHDHKGHWANKIKQKTESLEKAEEQLTPDHIIEHLKQTDQTGDPDWIESLSEHVNKHPAWKRTQVPIASIDTGESRNPDVVSEYAEMSPDTMPPVVAAPDTDGSLFMLDGGHRAQAAQSRGETHIDAFVPSTVGLDKAALVAGKTGRHQVKYPVGSQVDSGPSAAHEGGEIKVTDPETGKSKWRSVRAGVVMSPDGTPTSSRNPSGG